MFDMANDSSLFRTAKELKDAGFILTKNVFLHGAERYLPLYEAKMAHLFNHRFGTYDGQTQAQANQGKLPELSDARLEDPSDVAQPQYWVAAREVDAKLAGRDAEWLLAWRRITGTEKARTIIASALPRAGVGDSAFLMFPQTSPEFVIAALSSFALDYLARQKIAGTNASYFLVEQLPIPPPEWVRQPATWADDTLNDWFLPRLLELVYTSTDMEPFARELDHHGPPFRWIPERRALLRAELDAAFFHLYGLAEADVDYVMDTFPIVKRRDEEKFGHYRTKALILDVYRRMAEATSTGAPYETTLDPPPADPRVAHPSPSRDVVVDV